MVRHHTVTQDIDAQASRRIRHGLDEGVVIRRFVKHDLAPIAAIENVVPRAGNRNSCGSGHGFIIRRESGLVQYCFRPLF